MGSEMCIRDRIEVIDLVRVPLYGLSLRDIVFTTNRPEDRAVAVDEVAPLRQVAIDEVTDRGQVADDGVAARRLGAWDEVSARKMGTEDRVDTRGLVAVSEMTIYRLVAVGLGEVALRGRRTD